MKALREKILWWAADRRLKADKPLIIGIGGAIAKTSTKEAVGAVLEAAFPNEVYVSHGNLNTYLGVPLSLLGYNLDFHEQKITWQWLPICIGAIFRSFSRRLPKYAVVELGTDATGDLPLLLEHIHPTIGLLTIVGPAHLQNYDSEQAIAEEESSLIKALPPSGLAVINKQDKYVDLHRKNAKCKVIEVDCDLEHIATTYAETIGQHFSVSAEKISQALDSRKKPAHRFHRYTLGGHIILDDAYNANPLSIEAALNILKTLPGRKVAILGAMLELGPDEKTLHQEVGKQAHAVADLIIGVGELATEYQPDHYFASSEVALPTIFSYLQEGDSILVKGSRGIHMEKITEAFENKWE